MMSNNITLFFCFCLFENPKHWKPYLKSEVLEVMWWQPAPIIVNDVACEVIDFFYFNI